ncbi:transposase [Candidatus Babeliales bacterium]|nr:transposase [Candidatus Babeliales bacterium]
MHLDRALKGAFDKKNPKRFPRFKKKGQRDSFKYPQGFKIDGNKIFLPKIGFLRFFKSRDIEGTPKNITLSKKGEHWFLSIQVEQGIKEPVHPSDSAIGIDMGVKRFATVSDGTFVEPLSSFRNFEEKLAKEQQKLLRKTKGSNNWKRQKVKVSKVHIKIADVHNDFIHKASTTISKNHAVAVLEDLRISNMSRSAKRNMETPGRNVRAKSGLNKSILDQGWHEFRRQIEYKETWNGGMVISVPPQNTSRTCPICGLVSPENRKTQADFSCVQCGYKENADFVAAINILAVGHTVLAGREAVRP